MSHLHQDLKEQVINIKKMRTVSKIAQKDLAKNSATTIQTISKWESEQYMKVPVNQLLNIMIYICNRGCKSQNFIKAKDNIIKICQNIKRVREINHITQQELATVCGVTPQSIWRWENSNYQFLSFENLLEIIIFMESRSNKV